MPIQDSHTAHLPTDLKKSSQEPLDRRPAGFPVRHKPLNHMIKNILRGWPRAGAIALTTGICGMAMPMTSNALTGTLSPAELDGTNGFIVSGLSDAPDNFSYRRDISVAIVGDINHDTIDDFVVTQATESYVIFGTTAGFPTPFDVATINGSNGFVIDGDDLHASRLGDVNKDGAEDLGLADGGASYVVFGNAQGFPVNFSLSTLNGNNGFVIEGAAPRIAEGNDVNGDGFGDIVISGYRNGRYGDPSSYETAGKSYVVFGRNLFPATISVSTLNGIDGFEISGTGGDASGAGDLNGDGLDDIITSAPRAEYSTTAATSPISYIVYGNRASFPATIDTSNLDGNTGLTIAGRRCDNCWADSFSYASATVTAGGDINGDGVDDALIDLFSIPEIPQCGIITVFGSQTSLGKQLIAENAYSGEPADLRIRVTGTGSTKTSCNQSRSASGDLNGDGFDDIAVGLSTHTGGYAFDDQGRGSVMFGPVGPEGFTEDFSFVGERHTSAGRTVSANGDINGDGIDDFIISSNGRTDPFFAYLYDEYPPEIYVVFGQKKDIAPSTPLVQCPGDINGNGITEIAVTANGTTRIKGLNGGLVSQFNFSNITGVVELKLMPDINSNGAPELVALGKMNAEIRDSLTGAQLAVVDFDPSLTPTDLELVLDQTSNGIPELAMLGQGSVKVEVKDPFTGLIKRLSFNNYFNPMDLEIYPDLNDNGSPEIAVLSDNQNASKGDKIEIRDLSTGNLVRNIWLGRGWQVLQQAPLADRNGNGSKEVAVLRVKNNGDAVSVLLRDTKTAQGLGSIWFDRNYPPIQLLTIADVNSNGADEVVVFGQRFNGGNQKAQVKDSKTRALIRAVFFDKNFMGQDMATCADINGNDSEELVLLGKRTSDGKLRAIVKDAKTGTLIGAVNF